MSTVKVWVKTNQLDKIGEGKSPDKYWTSFPNQESDILEMNILVSDLQRWQTIQRKESNAPTGKRILND